ncbi:MAG: 50S ribosomal protein L25, partial [Streptosporangiaceae bacterium]
ISLEAEATHIPQGVDVDVEGMEMGQAIYAKDLKLPVGSTLQVEPDTLVLHVIAQQTAEEAGEETAEAAPEVPESLDSSSASEGE